MEPESPIDINYKQSSGPSPGSSNDTLLYFLLGVSVVAICVVVYDNYQLRKEANELKKNA